MKNAPAENSSVFSEGEPVTTTICVVHESGSLRRESRFVVESPTGRAEVAAAGIGRELGKLFLGTFSPAGWAAGLMAMKTAAEEMAATLAEMPPEE